MKLGPTLSLFLLSVGLSFGQTTGAARRELDNTFKVGKTQSFLGIVDMGTATRTRPCRIGNGAPTGQNGTQGDCYNQSDATAGQRLWWATATGTPATWTLQAGTGGGGGGGSVFTGSTAVTSTHSAAPTFSLADISVKSPTRFQPGALTSSVTSVTFTNKTAGAKFSISWTQDGTGSRTVTYGASASNTCAIFSAATSITTQQLEVSADGTTVTGTGCSVSGAPAGLLGCVDGATSGTVCIYGPATGGGTITLPSGATTLVGEGTTQTLTNKSISAGQINSGTMATARLGSGSASVTTFLRGDSIWATPSGGGGGADITGGGGGFFFGTPTGFTNLLQAAGLSATQYWPFTNPSPGAWPITKLIMEVGTTHSGKLSSWALFDESKNLISGCTSTTSSLSSAGEVAHTLTGCSVTARTGYLAWCTDSSSAFIQDINSGAAGYAAKSLNFGGAVVGVGNPCTGTTTLLPPATVGTITGSNGTYHPHLTWKP